MCYGRCPLPVTWATVGLVLLNHRSHVLPQARNRWDDIGTNLHNLLFMETATVFSHNKHVYACNYMLPPKSYLLGLESLFPNIGIFWWCLLYSILHINCVFLSQHWSIVSVLLYIYFPSFSLTSSFGNNLKWLCCGKQGDTNLSMWGFLSRSSESPLNLRKSSWLTWTSCIIRQGLWRLLWKKGGDVGQEGWKRRLGRGGNALEANF